MRRTLDYNGKKYLVGVTNYVSDPMAMAVVFKDVTEIPEGSYPDPLIDYDFCATVNLGNYYVGDRNDPCASFVQPYSSFIDSNSPVAGKIFDILQNSGLAEPYTKWGTPVEKQSGFVSYPLYEFDKEKLKELDPEGCKCYEE